MGKLILFLILGLIYTLLNYWVGLRLWQLLGQFIPFLTELAYWLAFWLVAMSYLIGRAARKIIPLGIARLLTIVGSYWLAAMAYFVLTLAIIEAVWLVDKVFNWNLVFWSNPPVAPYLGIAVLLLVVGIVLYGWHQARKPMVHEYSLIIPKQAGNLRKLHVVAVSDLHLGPIVHSGRLAVLVEMIQQLKPDLILLAGDIVDEDPGPFIEQNMKAAFLRLKTQYGIYAVPGNHEYIGGHWNDIFAALREAGVHVLQDQVVKVADSFYLTGRDDWHRKYFTGTARKSLSQIIGNINLALPVLLIDHQPNDLTEPQEQGVDLQISGHTHRGQFFPNNLITKQMFEVDWGYLRRDNLQVIVSSGFGTWGPPIRVASPPELLDIKIRFQADEES